MTELRAIASAMRRVRMIWWRQAFVATAIAVSRKRGSFWRSRGHKNLYHLRSENVIGRASGSEQRKELMLAVC